MNELINLDAHLREVGREQLQAREHWVTKTENMEDICYTVGRISAESESKIRVGFAFVEGFLAGLVKGKDLSRYWENIFTGFCRSIPPFGTDTEYTLLDEINKIENDFFRERPWCYEEDNHALKTFRDKNLPLLWELREAYTQVSRQVMLYASEYLAKWEKYHALFRDHRDHQKEFQFMNN